MLLERQSTDSTFWYLVPVLSSIRGIEDEYRRSLFVMSFW